MELHHPTVLKTGTYFVAGPKSRLLVLEQSDPEPPPPDPVCGDGTVNPPDEECDDGNIADGDGCSSLCQIEDLPPPPPPVDCAGIDETTADAVMSDTGDPFALKSALASVGAGGSIYIRLGTYIVPAVATPFITNKFATICGELGPNGERPHIKGDPASKPTSLIGWGPTNGNITIENLELSGAGTRNMYAGTGNWQPHSQRIIYRNVYSHDAGHHCLMVGSETNTSTTWGTGTWNDEVEIYDSEFARCALTHNVYVDGVKSAKFIRSKTYDPGSLHALKIVATEIEVRDSVISNAQLDGTVRFSPPHPTRGYWHGSAPISFVAGQKGVVTGNRIVWDYDKASSGGHAAGRQQRHAIQGHDDPNYYPVDGTEFWDAAFWAAVANAGTGIVGAQNNSPYLLGVYWSGNTFEAYNDNPLVTPVGVLNQGTYPNKPRTQGSSRAVPLQIPAGWVERSADFLYEGSDPAHANIWIGTWTKAESRSGPLWSMRSVMTSTRASDLSR